MKNRTMYKMLSSNPSHNTIYHLEATFLFYAYASKSINYTLKDCYLKKIQLYEKKLDVGTG